MPPDDAAALPGDLLLQAVEGMERPLFVLDEEWCFRYVNPAGARVLDRAVEYMLGRNIWTEFPEAVGSPFEELYTRVRSPASPAARRAGSGRWRSGSAPMPSSPTPPSSSPTTTSPSSATSRRSVRRPSRRGRRRPPRWPVPQPMPRWPGGT